MLNGNVTSTADFEDMPYSDNQYYHAKHSHILDETVKLLFMGNETAAQKYLSDNDLSDFKFYTLELEKMGITSANSIAECLVNWGYNSERYAYSTKEDFLKDLCDWSETICNPTNHTRASQYSTSRTNNNIDAVMAMLFTNYYGSLRTFNISEANIKVVPFPPSSSWRCSHFTRGGSDNSIQILRDRNLTQLHDHLFLFLNDHTLSVEKLASYRPGQLVVPYVNTNSEYQPDNLISSMNPAKLERFFSEKKYALAAVFSDKISGNGYARRQFVDKADSFFGNGTLEHNNGTLGGMPVRITVIREKRKMVGEQRTMSLYRESLFCPCFRGDTPNQKRIFDAILSECIPVVMAHYFKANAGDKYNSTSYFAPARNTGNSKVYPWAKGSFGEKHTDMGIDYSKLVIEIDEAACGEMDCLPLVLEKIMKDGKLLRDKQQQLVKYARLFSYGLQNNAFQYVDAMSALLVRARHYVVHEAHT